MAKTPVDPRFEPAATARWRGDPRLTTILMLVLLALLLVVWLISTGALSASAEAAGYSGLRMA